MLDVWASGGIGVEKLDVKHNGDDVHVKPKTRAQIGALERGE